MMLESNPMEGILDVKKRFTEAQIIGFMRELEAGLAVTELSHRHNPNLDTVSVYLEGPGVSI
jgi:hypothetical protein